MWKPVTGEGDVRGARGKGEGELLDQLLKNLPFLHIIEGLPFTRRNVIGEEGAADKGSEAKRLEEGRAQ